MERVNKDKIIVVALGGNVITNKGEKGDISEQFANTRRGLAGVARLAASGYRLAITHGNGPQVGNELIRVEMSRGAVPALPLGVLVGDTEGGMGYMIEQCFLNVLRDRGVKGARIATLVTQVLTDRNDPCTRRPVKFVGPFIDKDNIEKFTRERGWVIKEDPGRGYRRVVPSPKPLAIVNKDAIKRLLDDNFTVIAAGGGGIPVYIDERGWYEGVDGVVDKDFASAVLARDIGADTLLLLTGVDKVALDFGRPGARNLDGMTAAEARRYYEEGHFPDGSMGPKVMAAVEFIEGGGGEAIIASPALAFEAVGGGAGTRIIGA